MNVSWKTSYNDVQVYLEHTSRYFNATRSREQIATTLRTSIRKAEMIYQRLLDRMDDAAMDAKFRAIAAIQRGADGLARLYGFSGEKSLFLTNVNVTPGEGIMNPQSEWAKHLPPEKLQELREMVITFHKARYEQAAVPTEFTVDEDAERDVAPPKPSVENGRANGNDDGPVTLKGG